MKLPTIKINIAPLFSLFNKKKRDKLKLRYYDFLNTWYHGSSRSNTDT